MTQNGHLTTRDAVASLYRGVFWGGGPLFLKQSFAVRWAFLAFCAVKVFSPRLGCAHRSIFHEPI